MAVLTLGTTLTTSLQALLFKRSIGSMTPVDEATLRNLIKDDINVAHPRVPEAFSNNGELYIPNRGYLKVFTGDYVGVDSQGWPILVSANSIANAAWIHS